MASRDDLQIAIDATTKGYEAGMERAQKATFRYEDSIVRANSALADLERSLNDDATKKIEKRNQALERSGAVALGVGTAVVAGLGFATKAAIDWESAWAGVEKVTDGNAKQMGVLQEQLRGLTRVLPASHAEIAGVAEAAGQLGVARQDVAAFTKTAIDLGNTTNLMADEAATGLARFSNIMKEPIGNVSRLGSSLVALGNDGASTESEILDMSLRIAAGGKLIGLSSGEVLGYANALSSLGVEAEAGGTAVSQTFAVIDKAVSSGGPKLEGFARLAGMSVGDFQRTWGENAPAAIQAFLNGLQRVNTEGGNVYGTLEDLGITGVRQTDTLLRLAQSGDLLADSLATGNDAFRENSALVEEAAKRYDTTESKAKIAYNTFKDGAIDIGNTLLPALAGLATGLADVFGWFADLPDPIKGVLTVLAAVGGTALVAGGAFLTLAPRVLDTVDAFRTLKDTSPGAAGGVGKLTAALGALGLAYAAVAASGAVFGQSQDPAGVGKYTGAILDLANGADGANKKVDALFQADKRGNALVGAITAKDRIDGLRDAIDAVDPNKLTAITEKTQGLLGYDTRSGDATEMIEQYDAALTSLVQSGAADQAAEGAKYFADQARDAGLKTDEIAKLLPGYNDALADAENQSKTTGDATAEAAAKQDVATEAWQDGADAAAGLGEETKTLKEQLDDLNGAYLDRREANRQWQESLDSARKALEENGATLDINTKKGRDNAAALDDLAKRGADRLSAAAADGESQDRLNRIYEVQRERLVATAEGYGMSREAAERYADQALSVPTEISTEVKAETKTATKKVQAAADLRVPDKSFIVNAQTSGAIKKTQGLAGFIEATLQAISPVVDVTLSAKAVSAGALIQGASKNPGLFGLTKAEGGEIPGWMGTPGQDSVPALLMPREHVLTVADVDAMGGQAAVYQWRRDLHSGAARRKGDIGQPGRGQMVQRFADGGAVVPSGFKVNLSGLDSAVSVVKADFDGFAADLSAELSRLTNRLLLSLGGGVGLSPAEIARGQAFAKSQVGKPYVWGGVGPGGYDCSGFVSAVLNAALGMNPYSRRGATGSMPWSGFADGAKGAFSVGWFTGNPGHTAAKIGNLNVESYGGHGPAVGSGARGPNDGMFNRHMHYAGKRDTGGMFPNGSWVLNTSGRREWVLDPQETQHYEKGGAVSKSGNLTMRPITAPRSTGFRPAAPGYETTQGFVDSRAVAPDVAPSLRAVSAALAAMRKEARDVTAAEKALAKDRARAKKTADTVAETEKRLEKLRNGEKASKAEIADVETKLRKLRNAEKPDKEAIAKVEAKLRAMRRSESPDKAAIAKLDEQLKKQRASAKTAADRAGASEKNLETQRDQLTSATDAWKDAQAALIDATRQKAEDLFGTIRDAADKITSQGAAFGGSGTSVTAEGLLLKKQRAAAGGEEYTRLVASLRARKLNTGILDELLAEGSTDEALALARSLSAASAKTIADLNAQQTRLGQAGARYGAVGVAGAGNLQVVNNSGTSVTINLENVTTVDVAGLTKGLRDETGRALLLARSGSR